jgi:hypothetical protein
MEALESCLQRFGYERIQQIQAVTEDLTDPEQKDAYAGLESALRAAVHFARCHAGGGQ